MVSQAGKRKARRQALVGVRNASSAIIKPHCEVRAAVKGAKCAICGRKPRSTSIVRPTELKIWIEIAYN